MSIETNSTILSSRKRRIAAFLIDHISMVFIMMSIIFLTLGPNFIDEANTGEISSDFTLIMMAIFFIYFAKDSIKGISIGRWIMGIMVRDENNSDKIPSFGKLIIRNLSLIIWPLELIVLAVSTKKKRLGDSIVKTIVIKNPNKAIKVQRVVGLIGIILVFFVSILVFTGTAMKSSEAYKTAIQEIEQNEEILNELQGIKGYGILPTGNINITNGQGQAQLEIKVIGYDKDLYVNLYLTKEQNSEWELIEIIW